MPMDIAPAISSAMPPSTTSLDSPRDDKPAVSANGTVRPSERPITLLIISAAIYGTSGVGGHGADKTAVVRTAQPPPE